MFYRPPSLSLHLSSSPDLLTSLFSQCSYLRRSLPLCCFLDVFPPLLSLLICLHPSLPSGLPISSCFSPIVLLGCIASQPVSSGHSSFFYPPSLFMLFDEPSYSHKLATSVVVVVVLSTPLSPDHIGRSQYFCCCCCCSVNATVSRPYRPVSVLLLLLLLFCQRHCLQTIQAGLSTSVVVVVVLSTPLSPDHTGRSQYFCCCCCCSVNATVSRPYRPVSVLLLLLLLFCQRHCLQTIQAGLSTSVVVVVVLSTPLSPDHTGRSQYFCCCCCCSVNATVSRPYRPVSVLLLLLLLFCQRHCLQTIQAGLSTSVVVVVVLSTPLSPDHTGRSQYFCCCCCCSVNATVSRPYRPVSVLLLLLLLLLFCQRHCLQTIQAGLSTSVVVVVVVVLSTPLSPDHTGRSQYFCCCCCCSVNATVSRPYRPVSVLLLLLLLFCQRHCLQTIQAGLSTSVVVVVVLSTPLSPDHTGRSQYFCCCCCCSVNATVSRPYRPVSVLLLLLLLFCQRHCLQTIQAGLSTSVVVVVVLSTPLSPDHTGRSQYFCCCCCCSVNATVSRPYRPVSVLLLLLLLFCQRHCLQTIQAGLSTSVVVVVVLSTPLSPDHTGRSQYFCCCCCCSVNATVSRPYRPVSVLLLLLLLFCQRHCLQTIQAGLSTSVVVVVVLSTPLSPDHTGRSQYFCCCCCCSVNATVSRPYRPVSVLLLLLLLFCQRHCLQTIQAGLSTSVVVVVVLSTPLSPDHTGRSQYFCCCCCCSVNATVSRPYRPVSVLLLLLLLFCQRHCLQTIQAGLSTSVVVVVVLSTPLSPDHTGRSQYFCCCCCCSVNATVSRPYRPVSVLLLLLLLFCQRHCLQTI